MDTRAESIVTDIEPAEGMSLQSLPGILVLMIPLLAPPPEFAPELIPTFPEPPIAVAIPHFHSSSTPESS